jgi:phosphohistidine phosphatase
MILYFLRHGLAGDSTTWQGDDRERPLTSKGIKHMEQSAAAFRKLGVKVDAILSSPLKRAMQTASIVAKALEMEVIQDERLVYGFGLERLEQIISENPKASALMLVGHEPDFSSVVGELTGGSEIVMKKGGFARVDLVEGSAIQGQLVWLLPPKVLSDED